MRIHSGRGTRWAALLCGMAQLSWLLACGAPLPSSRKYVGEAYDSKTSGQMSESFSDLWQKWTVNVGVTGGGGSFSSPFTMGAGSGQGGDFGLRITATLMDSSLIRAGLEHYAALAQMTPEEQAEYRSAYFRRYRVEECLLIWCELSTGWAELHLDLNRWTIFIEDDQLNRHEPAEILEQTQPSYPRVRGTLSESKAGWRPGLWEIHRKTLMLCFPRKDLLDNPVLSPEVKFLKLVFQGEGSEKTQAEGIWVFRK